MIPSADESIRKLSAAQRCRNWCKLCTDGDAWAATHWPRVCTDILHFPQKTLLLMLMHHYITNTNQLEKLEAAKAA